MALNKLPKQYHPDFKSPNVMPSGNYVIDWNSPQSKNLLLAYSGNDSIQGIRELTGRGSRATPHEGTPVKKIINNNIIAFAETFDGSSAEKETGLQGLVDTDFTLCFWLNRINTGTIVYVELSDNTLSNRYGWDTSTPNVHIFSVPDNGNIYTGTTDYPQGELIHVAYTVISGDIKQYRNGVLFDSGTDTFTAPSGIDTISFGARSDGNFNAKCELADIRLYKGRLNAAQIKAIYDPSTRWDLFKPANPSVYYTAQAAGGGTTGVIVQNLSAFTQSASGTVVNHFTGTATQTLSSFTQSAEGTFSAADFTGTIDQTLSSFTQTASGTFTANVTGTITQNLNSFTQSASGFIPVTGEISQTLSSFTQSAVGAIPVEVPVSGGLLGAGAFGTGIAGSSKFGGGVSGNGKL